MGPESVIIVSGMIGRFLRGLFQMTARRTPNTIAASPTTRGLPLIGRLR